MNCLTKYGEKVWIVIFLVTVSLPWLSAEEGDKSNEAPPSKPADVRKTNPPPAPDPQELLRAVYRCPTGAFHLAGDVGTAHYLGLDGKPYLARLFQANHNSPKPTPIQIPAHDKNYWYYLQDPQCGDPAVLVWAFQREPFRCDEFFILKWVRLPNGEKVWKVHGEGGRRVLPCSAPSSSPSAAAPGSYGSLAPQTPPANREPPTGDDGNRPSVEFTPEDDFGYQERLPQQLRPISNSPVDPLPWRMGALQPTGLNFAF